MNRMNGLFDDSSCRLGLRALVVVAGLLTLACGDTPSPGLPKARTDATVSDALPLPQDAALDTGATAPADAREAGLQHDVRDDATVDSASSTDASDVRMALCRLDAPTSCPEPAVRYADVAPIVERRCLSCHNGRSGNWPLTTYQHVADWQDTIRAAMLDCSMPPAEAQLPMPVEDRLLLLTWVRCGALP